MRDVILRALGRTESVGVSLFFWFLQRQGRLPAQAGGMSIKLTTQMDWMYKGYGSYSK